MSLSFVLFAVGGCKQFTNCKEVEAVRQVESYQRGLFKASLSNARLKPPELTFQRNQKGGEVQYGRADSYFLGYTLQENTRKPQGSGYAPRQASAACAVTGGIPHTLAPCTESEQMNSESEKPAGKLR